MALDIGRRRLQRAIRAARRQGRSTPGVVIVGGGLSGLAMAIQLVRSGVRNFTIVEQSDGVGGTWRDNTYPGSGCDVPSHLYSFSFTPKSDWTRRFAEQPEILSYAERCVQRFRLGPHLRLGTTVQRAELDEADRRWRLDLTSADGEDRSRPTPWSSPAASSTGPTSPTCPAWSSSPGPCGTRPAGTTTAIWPGSGWPWWAAGPAPSSSCLRWPSGRPSSPSTSAAPTTWARRRTGPTGHSTRWLFDNVGVVERAYRWWIYWGLEFRWIWFRKDGWAGRKLGQLFAKGIREEVVSERLPEQAVVPDYPIGCKRILISNDWYPALMRPTVEVVDEPIDHIEADAVVTADGRRRPADVLIFGTGFSTTDFLAHIPVVGEGGQTLAEAWSDGAHAYLGTAVPGFPNCYLLYGPNTNLGHNSILFMVERQINLILQAMAVQVRVGGGTGRLPWSG